MEVPRDIDEPLRDGPMLEKCCKCCASVCFLQSIVFGEAVSLFVLPKAMPDLFDARRLQLATTVDRVCLFEGNVCAHSCHSASESGSGGIGQITLSRLSS